MDRQQHPTSEPWQTSKIKQKEKRQQQVLEPQPTSLACLHLSLPLTLVWMDGDTIHTHRHFSANTLLSTANIVNGALHILMKIMPGDCHTHGKKYLKKPHVTPRWWCSVNGGQNRSLESKVNNGYHASVWSLQHITPWYNRLHKHWPYIHQQTDQSLP